MSLSDELLRVLGPEGLRRLQEAHGGERVFVASRPSEGQFLVELLGVEAALRLALRWGGQRIYVSVRKTSDDEQRDIAIRRDRRELGLPASRLATEYGLSERQVWRILGC